MTKSQNPVFNTTAFCAYRATGLPLALSAGIFMEEEIWKLIPFLDGYMASSFGRVKSIDRKVKGWARQPRFAKGRILSLKISNVGYYMFRPSSKTMTVHRAVALAFVPNPENKPCINHINGIKTDNRIENLEWSTYSENIIHAYKNKLMAVSHETKLKIGIGNQGSKHGMAILKESDIITIRALWSSGIQQKEIAAKFNLSTSAINSIIKKRIWKHV